MTIEWQRSGKGFAKTTCGRYQISITGTGKKPRYICFFVTGEQSEPFRNVGQAFSPESSREICQRHADEQGGTQ